MSGPVLPAPVVVGLGEALYDILPSGPVLGGAPLNFAVHARQLLDRHGPPAARVAVATRVGDDALGQRLREELAARGLETAAVQQDPARPTGTATVALVDGEPRFTITADAAWDHSAADAGWRSLAAAAGAVSYGTLGSRSPASAAAIAAFLEGAGPAIRLFDVNLRDPFHSPDLIRRLCRPATMLKVNERELPLVADVLGVPAGPEASRLARLREQAGLEAVILTRGLAGATIVTAEATVSAPARLFPAAEHADSVGAGDAFGAAVLVGRLLGWPIRRTLDVACETSGYVASQPGATPRLPS
ncbi:MAG: PfkB family carbohydrate kinase [Planctomycetota bacterium]